MHRLRRLLAVLALAALVVPGVRAAEDAAPRVELRTSVGPIVVELWPEEAPETVENFLGYVRTDFYDGLIFHRVIPYFMVQTGGYGPDLEYREPRGRVANESVGAPRNLRGTLAMARQRNPDSADSQFFVNVEDNDHLDADGARPGYTVFGRVVEGMDLVDRISMVETTRRGGMADVPVEDVILEEARVLGE
jgi:cyclophilin family peptidyl-prolyl cis-trans isomerase